MKVPHEIIDYAVKEALEYARDHESNSIAKIDEVWAMYQAQCVATDEFAKKAAMKSDVALTRRIAELEAQIIALNQTIVSKNIEIDRMRLAIMETQQ